MNTETPLETFKEWAFLELMGHRKLAGFVQETEIAGGKFLRIDAPDGTGKTVTQFYSPASVYAITPTTEAMVSAYAKQNQSAPVSRYELEFKEVQSSNPNQVQELDDELDHDDCDGCDGCDDDK